MNDGQYDEFIKRLDKLVEAEVMHIKLIGDLSHALGEALVRISKNQQAITHNQKLLLDEIRQIGIELRLK